MDRQARNSVAADHASSQSGSVRAAQDMAAPGSQGKHLEHHQAVDKAPIPAIHHLLDLRPILWPAALTESRPQIHPARHRAEKGQGTTTTRKPT